MKKSVLKNEYLDENIFWHITSKLNIESIDKNGLVPRDGNRDGKNISPEDPVPRVFFSQGLQGVLGQANNLAFLINNFVKNIERTDNGDDGKNVKKKLQEFLNNSVNNEIEKKNQKNGGFIDIANFIKDDIFKNGINTNLNEQNMDEIIYNITKTIWENNVCLKADLKENVDYSWSDTNYSATGDKKGPMTKKNMHAFEGHTIDSDIIEIITDEDGNPKTTWDVFKEMAIYYKKEYPNKDYLPVEEWESGYEDENGQIIYTGEMNHEKDYLSMFIEMEEKEREKGIEKSSITEQQIGKSTINSTTEQKDLAYDKILSKVHKRNYPEEIYEHTIGSKEGNNE